MSERIAVIGMVSDLHNNTELIEEIRNRNTEIDILLVAGDLTQTGSEYEIKSMLNKLNGLGVEVILVMGNHDVAAQANKNLCDEFENITELRNEYIKVYGLTIYGSPYSLDCGWAFGFKTEDEMQNYLPDRKVDILLTHGGPNISRISTCRSLSGYGTVEIGSDKVTEYIRNYQPTLSISGHCHECSGNVEIIGKTQIINTSQKYLRAGIKTGE